MLSKNSVMNATTDLTRAEEEIMQLLWKKERAFVKELLEAMPDPKPAYNTVSTIVRILETKGFVGHEAFGKSHQYYPLISQEDYAARASSKLLNNYFDGSVEKLLSFFVKKEQLNTKELDELLKSIKNQKS